MPYSALYVPIVFGYYIFYIPYLLCIMYIPMIYNYINYKPLYSMV